MTFKAVLPWLQRGLAIVGLAAILAFVGQNLFTLFSVSTSSTDPYVGNFYSLSAPSDLALEYIQEGTQIQRESDEVLAAEVDQKIIKTGSLDLVVNHADESLAAVESLTQSKSGYVQTSTIQEHQDGTLSGYVTIRVPADIFDATIEELKALAVVVERETTSAEDVTEQYIDLAARLKNAQAQETRYVEILDVAKTVDEILQIESALGNIRGYIKP
ncbi:MAG: hypothetical protein UY76_C0027G0003 [Candidatus Uhrbacteria bacterium GW2011_GWA2_52_8d]|uniref:DUF4349 domain-containing protein n=1 Tax=Candidatus Uhrbacteria bacterium GW2011_GWA2_52_8d TaxID=1618979 RepID=A0A0G1XNE6_9BACT|nr:MAG: hypothetical protein UY76_C0027G0003 [Candidatus Uhrbacteria bacterium GW2011_GWA2_52_8d]